MLPRLIDSAAAQSRGQQRLDNVNRAHLVQASGSSVLQIETKLVLDFGIFFVCRSRKWINEKNPRTLRFRGKHSDYVVREFFGLIRPSDVTDLFIQL